MFYYLVKSTGEVEILPNGELETLQNAVGGYIERVPTKHPAPTMSSLIVNEEGLLQRLPYNFTGSLFTGRSVVGDVVIESDKPLENGAESYPKYQIKK